MKVWDREHYKIKEYADEQFRLDIYDEETRTEISKYNKEWSVLYEEAKREAKEGKVCSIWELKWELIP